MLNFINHEFTKSKKDNLFQLHMLFSQKCWGLGNYSLDSNKLSISIEDCNENPLLEVIVPIPEKVMNSFEFIDFTISKNKDELYVYFFEYPYEDDDIEIVYSDSILVRNAIS